ncbi:TrkA C-terminal domain-containing protein [Lacrimispora brassicae]
MTREKVLVEGMVFHGSEAEGQKVSEIQWPRTCLLVSLMRGEAEFVPRGETKFAAGEKSQFCVMKPYRESFTGYCRRSARL